MNKNLKKSAFKPTRRRISISGLIMLSIIIPALETPVLETLHRKIAFLN